MAKRKQVSFYGANDVYLTKKNIAVRRISTKSDNGIMVFKDTTRYYPKTKSNMASLSRICGRVRHGRN